MPKIAFEVLVNIPEIYFLVQSTQQFLLLQDDFYKRCVNVGIDYFMKKLRNA